MHICLYAEPRPVVAVANVERAPAWAIRKAARVMLVGAPSSQPALLEVFDPTPVTVINAGAETPLILVCEHAGRAIPRTLGDLGLPEAVRASHIGWDIGAEGVARQLAERLGAPLVIQNYSRLVIDCNRPPDAPDSIPETSDGVPIPANTGLGPDERQRRLDEIFHPFDTTIARLLARHPRKAAFTIHSFNPEIAGKTRPWNIGFLYRGDTKTSSRLRDRILAQDASLCVGMNAPYAIHDASDWFVPRYAERLALAHSLIEIRNDLIADEDGQAVWAARLGDAIEDTMAEL